MNPRRTVRARLLVATFLCALLGAATARALSSKSEERRQKLEAAAEAERQRLGLDRDRTRLYALYPTPEVQFADPVPAVEPGASTRLRVTGHFPKGSNFLIGSDDVQVLQETVTAGAWEARVKVAAAALPGDVNLHVQAPVSGAQSDGRVLSIRGCYALQVTFDDGLSATVTPEKSDPSGTVLCNVEWRKRGEKKPFRTSKASFEPGSPLRITVLPGEDEQALAREQVASASAAFRSSDFQKASEQIAKDAQACAKLAGPEMQGCMEKVGKASAELQASLQAKVQDDRARLAPRLPPGASRCGDWRLRGSGGKVEGEAGCPEGEPVKFTGTIRYVRPLDPGP